LPRVEFSSLPELKRWVKFMREKKRDFVAFSTKAGELILQPTTSTQPVTYGYAAEITTEAVKELVTEHNLTHFKIKRFEWKSENNLKKE